MASGIPVVQPRVGHSPELIKETGGGVTYSPNTAAASDLSPRKANPK